jgi:hypothetical protein
VRKSKLKLTHVKTICDLGCWLSKWVLQNTAPICTPPRPPRCQTHLSSLSTRPPLGCKIRRNDSSRPPPTSPQLHFRAHSGRKSCPEPTWCSSLGRDGGRPWETAPQRLCATPGRTAGHSCAGEAAYQRPTTWTDLLDQSPGRGPPGAANQRPAGARAPVSRTWSPRGWAVLAS